jgi:folate-binding protein YgfZ
MISNLLFCKNQRINNKVFYNIKSYFSNEINKNKNFIKVLDREYIKITGKDTKKFLQGICSNDTSKLIKNGDCIAATFLQPTGRILADSLIYDISSKKISNEESNNKENVESVVIETHSLLISPLAKYLGMYKLRSKVKIEKISLDCYLSFKTMDNKEIELNAKEFNSIVASVDPRCYDLGTRFLILNDKDDKIDTKEYQQLKCIYNQFRMSRGIAEGPEITNKIPLECNLDFLNYINFNKGCYVGQELIARTKYKGLIRKRLLPFLINSNIPDSIKSNNHFDLNQFKFLNKEEINDIQSLVNINSNNNNIIKIDDKISLTLDNGDNTSIGEVICINNNQSIGIAMIRLNNILSLTNIGPFYINNSTSIQFFQPSWWPQLDPVTGKSINTN